MKVDLHSDSELRKIYDLKNIAVVGMSKNEEKGGITFLNTLLNMATILSQ